MPLFPNEFPFKRPTSPGSLASPSAPEVVENVAIAAPIETPSVLAPDPSVAPNLTVAAAPPVSLVPIQPEEPMPQPLPAAAQVAVQHERRRSPRQAFLARALVRNEIGHAPGWKVDLLNISMLGIRFRSDAPLIVGDRASVKLEVGPLRWATKLRVIHSVQLDDGTFAVGCQFISNELARPARRAA